MFKKRKSYGPKINLTERQEEALVKRLNDAGLSCFVDNSWTGSVYIMIDLPGWEKNIRDEWFLDIDRADGRLATIRLSGHETGRHSNHVTHSAIFPTKKQCMESLNRWVAEIIDEHSREAKAIIASGPPADD
jgi:hypothetical protein